MSFLPLACDRLQEDDGHVHPYAIDEIVQERHEELLRLGRAERDVLAARRATGYRPWRQRAGQALVALAVAVAVPRPRRRTARQQATTALGFDPPC